MESRIAQDQVATAVEHAKNWLLHNQIGEQARTYDVLEGVDERQPQGQWQEVPLPKHLIGAYYANLYRNSSCDSRPGRVRRQYYNGWHTAQAGVALLEYLDYHDDPAVRRSVDLAWQFLDRHQLKEGRWAGVFVEADPAELQYPLEDYHSFGHLSPKAGKGYANYDNIEVDLFPLELYRRTRQQRYLDAARLNAEFYLKSDPQSVFFECETRSYSISGMTNDAICGRLAEFTGEAHFADVFAKQIRRLNFLGLDLRAQNNMRNIYWDATACMYAVDHVPGLLGAAMAKLAFLAEHALAGQKESGVLWFRFKDAGVPDTAHVRHQDGAATFAMIRVWGKMYDLTGDPRWLTAIRRAVAFGLTTQYPASDDPGFAGAFEYAGWVKEPEGHRFEFLRDISTIFALRALLPLLKPQARWARDLWN